MSLARETSATSHILKFLIFHWAYTSLHLLFLLNLFVCCCHNLQYL